MGLKSIRRLIVSVIVLVSVYPLSSYADDNPILKGDHYRPVTGSSYWETSNIREWLNSNQSTVNYTNNPPNSKEEGFLTGFTKEEQNAIAVTRHRSIMNFTDVPASNGGSISPPYGIDPAPFLDVLLPGVDDNWKDYYYRNVNDRVFLLSPVDLYYYVQRRGMSLQKSLTERAKQQLNISSPHVSWSVNFDVSSGDGDFIEIVDEDGLVSGINCSADQTLGVVPAMYINPDYKFSNGVLSKNLNIGDHVTFGRYSGDPIDWTVINKTSDGYVLLWSTYALTMKPFDSPGDYSYENSNISFPNADVDISSDMQIYYKMGDSTPPTISVENLDDTTSLKNSSYTINIKATDNDSGVAFIILPDGTAVNGSTASYEVKDNKEIFIQAVDKAGNYSDYSLPIGNINQPSKVEISTSSDGWTNKDVDVNIFSTNDIDWYSNSVVTSSRDAGGPDFKPYTSYAGKRFRVTGNVTLAGHTVDLGDTITGIGYSYKRRIPIGRNGYHYSTNWLHPQVFMLKDIDGVTKDFDFIFTVPGDYYSNLHPWFQIDIPHWDQGKYTVKWSNIKYTLLDNDDLKINKIILPSGDEVNASSYTDKLTKEGTYTYKVVDNRGMVTSKTVSVLIDKVPPTLNVTGNPTSEVHNSIYLHVEGSDADSGVSQIQKPNGEWVDGSSLDYKVTENGTYTFTVKDKAGNTTSKTVTVSNIGSKFNIYKVSDNTSFSSASLENGSQTLNSKGVDLVVEDNRETGVGWHLMVKALTFSEVTNGSHKLGSVSLQKPTVDNSNLKINGDSWVIDSGNAVSVVSSPIGKGMGTYHINFDSDKSLSVFIPYGSYAGSYSSEVSYELVTGP